MALPASKQIFSFTKRRKLGADIFFDKVASPYFDENVSHSMSSSEYMLVIIILEQDDDDIHHTDSFTQPKRDHQHQTIKEGK